jgi:hypothetical protein
LLVESNKAILDAVASRRKTRNVPRFERRAVVAGIVPEKVLLFRRKSLSAVRSPIRPEIGPTNLF